MYVYVFNLNNCYVACRDCYISIYNIVLCTMYVLQITICHVYNVCDVCLGEKKF